jgi:hypothetical protein
MGLAGHSGDWLAHWQVSRTSPAASTVRGYAGVCPHAGTAALLTLLEPLTGAVLAIALLGDRLSPAGPFRLSVCLVI